jgi:creatinine amidohydrolase
MKWLELTAEQLPEARDRADGVAMIPIGSIERHGSHLPMGCDTLIVQRIAEEVEAREQVVVLPVMTYTFVPQPMYQMGAINVKSALLLDYLATVLDEVHRNGFGKLVLLHAHGGNIPMSQAILQYVIEESKPYALYSIPPWAGAKLDEVQETPEVGHACELETSIALAVCPELVHMEAISHQQTFPADKDLDVGVAQTPVDWIARYPTCCTGDPLAATVEKGKLLKQMWVDNVVDTLRKIKRDQVVLNWMSRPKRH